MTRPETKPVLTRAAHKEARAASHMNRASRTRDKSRQATRPSGLIQTTRYKAQVDSGDPGPARRPAGGLTQATREKATGMTETESEPGAGESDSAARSGATVIHRPGMTRTTQAATVTRESDSVRPRRAKSRADSDDLHPSPENRRVAGSA